MKLINILLLVAVIAFSAGCGQMKVKPISTPELNVATAYSGMSAEDVESAILTACKNRGWKIINQTDDSIDATIHVRGKHSASVCISFSASHVKIDYKDSVNLRYGQYRDLEKEDEDIRIPKIHYNYNRWVEYLLLDINSALEKLEKSRTHSNEV